MTGRTEQLPVDRLTDQRTDRAADRRYGSAPGRPNAEPETRPRVEAVAALEVALIRFGSVTD